MNDNNMKKISIPSQYIKFFFFLLCSISILQATTKIMPLGDSITWDWHYDDPRTDAERSGYRNYLWYQLTDKGYSIDFVGSKTNGGAVKPHFDGNNEGYTGETSYQIANRIYRLLEMNPPEIILLHIGTNDSLYYPSTDTSGVEEILDQVDRFEKNSGTHIKVILSRIIKLPSNSTWISQFNNSIEAMARDRIARGDDIKIVDMENGAGLDYSRDLIDEIHPTDRGYEKMANVWFDALEDILSNKGSGTHPRMMADVNGDGLQDIVGFGNAGVLVSLSTGTGFEDADIWVNNFGSGDGWSTQKHPRMMADVDGDGMQDVVGFGNQGVYISPSNSTNFDNSALWIKDFGFNQGWR